MKYLVSVLTICTVLHSVYAKPIQAPPVMTAEQVKVLITKKSVSCGCSDSCTCNGNCQCHGNDRCSTQCPCNPVKVKVRSATKPVKCPPCHGEKDGEWTFDGPTGKWWKYMTATTTNSQLPTINSQLIPTTPYITHTSTPRYAPTFNYQLPTNNYYSGGSFRSGGNCGPGG